VPENLRDLVASVREHGADLGLAFDGDGDRLGVVDGEGSVIWPDRQMMLFAADVLASRPGAEIVFDGAQMHVPLPQPVTGSSSAMPPANQPQAGVSGDGPPAAASLSGQGNSTAGGLVNINTASAEELTSLPGIGTVKADAIIASRTYDSVDDLERVTGIGPGTVEKLTPLVTTK